MSQWKWQKGELLFLSLPSSAVRRPGLGGRISLFKMNTGLCCFCWGILERRQPEKAMAPTPVLLPGKSHGRRSLVGCSPWGREESDMTKWLPFHFSLSCIVEGNGNPLQCSCLENPRDGEPGGLPSMGSHRVGHHWSDLAAAAAVPFMHFCFLSLVSSLF